jgi:hypothetical protein
MSNVEGNRMPAGSGFLPRPADPIEQVSGHEQARRLRLGQLLEQLQTFWRSQGPAGAAHQLKAGRFLQEATEAVAVGDYQLLYQNLVRLHDETGGSDPRTKELLEALQAALACPRLTPEQRQWALEDFTAAETAAAVQEVKDKGGFEFEEFIHELEQVLDDRARPNG